MTWDGVNNRYLVVWEDSRDEAGRGLDVYGARVNGKATAVGIRAPLQRLGCR